MAGTLGADILEAGIPEEDSLAEVSLEADSPEKGNLVEGSPVENSLVGDIPVQCILAGHTLDCTPGIHSGNPGSTECSLLMGAVDKAQNMTAGKAVAQQRRIARMGHMDLATAKREVTDAAAMKSEARMPNTLPRTPREGQVAKKGTNLASCASEKLDSYSCFLGLA